MKPIDQHLNRLLDRARNASFPDDGQAPLGFATSVLSHVLRDKTKREPDLSSLWLRFSLASLPVAVTVMIACLILCGTDLPRDVDDLANSLIEAPFRP